VILLILELDNDDGLLKIVKLQFVIQLQQISQQLFVQEMVIVVRLIIVLVKMDILDIGAKTIVII
jgi:hypothetical protein